jgi:hypothetical protein
MRFKTFMVAWCNKIFPGCQPCQFTSKNTTFRETTLFPSSGDTDMPCCPSALVYILPEPEVWLWLEAVTEPMSLSGRALVDCCGLRPCVGCMWHKTGLHARLSVFLPSMLMLLGFICISMASFIMRSIYPFVLAILVVFLKSIIWPVSIACWATADFSGCSSRKCCMCSFRLASMVLFVWLRATTTLPALVVYILARMGSRA